MGVRASDPQFFSPNILVSGKEKIAFDQDDLREFANYHHPCPRRMWGGGGGSEPLLLTLFQVQCLPDLSVDPHPAHHL